MLGNRTLTESKGSWTKRFMAAAILQGAIVTGLTAFLLLGQAAFMEPEVSRVMAPGGAGTWFTFGYMMYIIVGVMGVADSALFYHYLENVLGKHIRGSVKALAGGTLY